MSTFVARLMQALGGRGYDSVHRRSVQTVVLYEAHRCIADNLATMRPFQRKIAVFDQAQALLEATNLSPQQRAEVMWRTATSKESLNPQTAWKRVKLIDKELEKICEKVKPLCKDGKSHDDVVNEYVTLQFETVTGQKDKAIPANWEHTHNNVILTFRMYYDGAELDSKLPEAVPIKEIVVPAAKPKQDDHAYMVKMPGNHTAGQQQQPQPQLTSIAPAGSGVGIMATTSSSTQNESAEDRLTMLKEIRAHMDLLNDFAGIIPQEQLLKRKRDLYLALPSAPPSTMERVKRLRQSFQGLEGLHDL